MLNPSTADGHDDDATIRRVVTFSAVWGYDGCLIVNLFALRSTSPLALKTHSDPIGPRNDDVLAALAASCSTIVAAWGAHPFGQRRAGVVLSGPLARRRLMCLGTTASGAPRHPLYVRSSTSPRVFRDS